MKKTKSEAFREILYKEFNLPPQNRFKPVYSEADFLAVLPDLPITSNEIAKRVRCSHPTAATYMKKLVEQGKAKRVEIIGGRDAVWEKVDETKDKNDSKKS